MPGIPQGRHIGEAGAKSITMVEVTETNIRIEERFVADPEFRRIEIDLTDIANWASALSKLEEALAEIHNSNKVQYMICRVVLLGKSLLYWHLKRDIDFFKAEAQEIALQFNNLFIEVIDSQIQSFAGSKEEVDPIDELRSLMEKITENSDLHSEAESYLETIVKKMPPTIRGLYGTDSNSRKKVIKRFLSEGTTEVIAALKGSQIQSEGI